MSRLESAIRRLEAQRDCIDAAAAMLAGETGCILELGLGNGRTYDHLRTRFPAAAIYVFDRQVRSHPDSTPDDDHLFLGDFFETLPEAARRLGRTAMLAHCDFGSGKDTADAAVARRLSAALAPLLRPGALVLSDQPLDHPGWQAVALPATVAAGRYHIHRVAA
ncbi:MAG: class I SAM-dependent methyltransferase [Alphaproteobacteria bacterium]